MRLTVVNTSVAALVLVVTAVSLSAQVLHDSPFYCDMSMLSAADRAHKDDIGRHLAAVRTGIRELSNGYEFQFPGDSDTLQQLCDWIVTERLCCPFFDFDLRINRESGSMALRLTGRAGTKAFIKADFGRWLDASR
jgi:hypothetical protein